MGAYKPPNSRSALHKRQAGAGHKRTHTGEQEILDMFKRAEEQIGARTCLPSGSKKATELDQILQFNPNAEV